MNKSPCKVIDKGLILHTSEIWNGNGVPRGMLLSKISTAVPLKSDQNQACGAGMKVMTLHMEERQSICSRCTSRACRLV